MILRLRTVCYTMMMMMMMMMMMILHLRTVCHTMNAFIGLFTWFGGCFFVCNLVIVVTCEQIINIFGKNIQPSFRQ